MPASDRKLRSEQKKSYRILLSGTVDADCSDALVGTVRREYGMRDITVEVVEESGYRFTVGGAIENFIQAFRDRNEPVPTFSISELGPARIAALSLIAERGFATMETLCEDAPHLSADQARAAIRDLFHHGKISREARGVYSITDIEEAYYDEIVEFRLIVEMFRPTVAEKQLLQFAKDDTTKIELMKAMNVSRQRIDQLVKRVVDKKLATFNGDNIKITSLGEIILNRSSIYPL